MPSCNLRVFSFVLLIFLVSLPAAFCQDFTIIAVPDTQNEAQYYPSVMKSQMQWIVDNQQALNIQMVLGEGDIVNDGADNTQQANADAAVRLLDTAGVPYMLAVGNHDYDGANPKPSPTPGTCQGGSASPSVNICSPLNGATVSSPVHVVAATTDSVSVKFIQIYVDGNAVFTTSGGSLDTNVAMAAGSRRVTVQAKDSAGVIFKQTIFITVQ